MHSLLADLLDLLLPVSCAACGVPGAPVCASCRAALAGPLLAVPASIGCPVRAAGRYDGVLRTLILEYKERGRADLAPPLAALLADAVGAEPVSGPPGSGGPVVLVPVPSTAAAARARGGDHMVRLAGVAAAHLRARGVACRAAPVLAVRGRRGDSVGLDAAARRANVAHTVVVRARPARRLRGARVVLLDDLVTTGATLAEAAGALTRAGWAPRLCVVLAATELRRARSGGSLEAAFR